MDSKDFQNPKEGLKKIVPVMRKTS